MRESQKQRIQRCIDFLRPLQSEFAESLSEVYWLGARNADPDQGPSYCRDCCDTHVDRLNAEHPDHEYLRDGGWGYEADTPEICDDCGAFLNCTLTHCGVASELEHWANARIALRVRYQASTAFELLLILESGSLEDYWLSAPHMQPYEVRRIKLIHRGVHALTRRIDLIAHRAAQRAQAQKEQGND